MARKLTFEIDIEDDGVVNIATISSGNLTLFERLGLVRLLESSVIENNNRQAATLNKKSRKKLKP